MYMYLYVLIRNGRDGMDGMDGMPPSARRRSGYDQMGTAMGMLMAKANANANGPIKGIRELGIRLRVHFLFPLMLHHITLAFSAHPINPNMTVYGLIRTVTRTPFAIPMCAMTMTMIVAVHHQTASFVFMNNPPSFLPRHPPPPLLFCKQHLHASSTM